MVFKIRILPCLAILAVCLISAGCSSSSDKQGRAQSTPLTDSTVITKDQQPTGDSILERASALSGYRAQTGDHDRPFIKFPNEYYQYETSCYRLDMNTPFTGIADIDQRFDNWSDGLRAQTMTELNESCYGGARDLYLDLTYETSVTRGQSLGVVFFAAKYTGGAHPVTDVETMNFNMNSGELLQYQDIFARTDGLYEFLSDYAYRALRPSLGEFWQDDTFTGGLDPKAENFQSFVVTPDGLVLIFEHYQIAPYSAGIQTCLVPLESLVRFQPRPGVWQ